MQAEGVPKANMSRGTDATAACPVETWSGETPQSLTEPWGGTQKAHCQLMCLLWHSVGGWTLRLPQGTIGWFCGVDEIAGPLPLVWENHAAGLQPGLQQHPPAGHRDFSCKELFLSVMRSACKKGGSKDLSRLQMNCHTLR